MTSPSYGGSRAKAQAAQLQKQEHPVVGDYNVTPTDLDIYSTSPGRRMPRSARALRLALSKGLDRRLLDVFGDERVYIF